MKEKIALICTAAILLIGLVGCGGGGGTEGGGKEAEGAQVGPRNFQYSCSQLYDVSSVVEHLEIKVGDTFTVSLCSDPESGFGWQEEAEIGDPNVVSQTSHEYVPAEEVKAIKKAMGTIYERGSDIYTFQATNPGTTYISLKYKSVETGASIWEFYLNLTVK